MSDEQVSLSAETPHCTVLCFQTTRKLYAGIDLACALLLLPSSLIAGIGTVQSMRLNPFNKLLCLLNTKAGRLNGGLVLDNVRKARTCDLDFLS